MTNLVNLETNQDSYWICDVAKYVSVRFQETLGSKRSYFVRFKVKISHKRDLQKLTMLQKGLSSFHPLFQWLALSNPSLNKGVFQPIISPLPQSLRTLHSISKAIQQEKIADVAGRSLSKMSLQPRTISNILKLSLVSAIYKYALLVPFSCFENNKS